MRKIPAAITFALFFLLLLTIELPAQDFAAVKGKNPVIIIPGITGSELVNSRTGERVWFKIGRSKDDDLRLPISPNLAQNRDSLIAKDIIRSVRIARFLPETEIYEKLIDAMTERGGYREAQWNNPGPDGHQDTFYVFPYDWRRDNVETARELIRRIETLKRRLNRPDLKFDVIAHSMGGLIARYAAMYGYRDIPPGNLRPDWSGSRHFEKIFLLGTPNEGSIQSFNALLNGYPIYGRLNLPFVRNISRFDTFTIPAAYQLLPHEGSLVIYDKDLKKIDLDIYDVKVWEKYGWGIWQMPNFNKNFTTKEQLAAKDYQRAVLNRARRFQAALNANRDEKIPVSFYLIGADCKETPIAALLLFDEKKEVWSINFKPTSFNRSNGDRVDSEEVKKILVGSGDSVVPLTSLRADNAEKANPNVLRFAGQILHCEGHGKLVNNTDIQDRLFEILNAL